MRGHSPGRLIWKSLLSAALLTACVDQANTPLPEDTAAPPATQTIETLISTEQADEPTLALPPGVLPENAELLFQGWNWLTRTSEIWMLDPQSRSLQPLYAEENTYYGAVVWSRDGQEFAYTRTSGYCPTASNSIWVHHTDQSRSERISEEIVIEYPCTEGLRPFYYLTTSAWSLNDQNLAVDVLTTAEVDTFDGPRLVLRSKPHLLDVQTGELTPFYPEEALSAVGLNTPYVRDYLVWQSFAANSNRVFMATSPEVSLERSDSDAENRVMFVTSLDDPNTIELVEPPAGVEPVFSDSSSTTCMSPNGEMLFLFDHTETHRRLWRLRLETDEWAQISEQPIVGSTRRYDWEWVRCSPDGRWIAWLWDTEREGDIRYYHIVFVNIEDGLEYQRYLTRSAEQGAPGRWILSEDGRAFLTLWSRSPGGGMSLLDPEGQYDDYLLIPYADLTNNLPPAEDFMLFAGPWQSQIHLIGTPES